MQFFAACLVYEFLSIAAGGFVAQRRFLVPAAMYAGLTNLRGVYLGAQTGIGTTDVPGVSLSPWHVLREYWLELGLLLLLSITIAAMAAVTGMKLAQTYHAHGNIDG